MASSSYGPVQAGVPGPEIDKFTPLLAAMHIVGGQVGLPLVVAAMLFSKEISRRRPTMLINFFVSWIVYSVIFCLLIYSGREQESISDTPLCYTQAVMIHGAIPLVVTTTFSLVLQLWLGLRYPNGFTRNTTVRTAVTTAMLVMPWFAFVVFTVVSIVIGVQQPELVNNTASYYCTIRFQPLLFTVPTYAAIVVTFAVGFEIAILVRILRRWKSMQQLRVSNPASFSMFVRIIIFTLYGFMTLGACLAFITSVQSVVPYLIEASLSPAVFIVFGIRKDIILAYCFWRKRDTGMDSTATFSSFRKLSLSSEETNSSFGVPPPVPPKDAAMA